MKYNQYLVILAGVFALFSCKERKESSQSLVQSTNEGAATSVSESSKRHLLARQKEAIQSIEKIDREPPATNLLECNPQNSSKGYQKFYESALSRAHESDKLFNDTIRYQEKKLSEGAGGPTLGDDIASAKFARQLIQELNITKIIEAKHSQIKTKAETTTGDCQVMYKITQQSYIALRAGDDMLTSLFQKDDL